MRQVNVFIIERSFKTKTNKQTKLHRDWLLTQSHFLEDFNLKILHPHTANAKAATRGVPQKNLVWKIMKNSQESLEPEHFFNVVADCRLATLLTRDSGISFSCEICENFLEHLFYKTLPDNWYDTTKMAYIDFAVRQFDFIFFNQKV